MNKQGLIDAVAIKGEMSKKDALHSIEAVFGVIVEALGRKEKVQLVGFGTFSVKKRASRTGRNPQTKEEIIIPATEVPHFKAGKQLKDIVKCV